MFGFVISNDSEESLCEINNYAVPLSKRFLTAFGMTKKYYTRMTIIKSFLYNNLITWKIKNQILTPLT